MSFVVVKFPSKSENIDVTINKEFTDSFNELIASNLFQLEMYWHPGSLKNIPRFTVKETGQVVSILPLIGVRPNSKSRRNAADECDITREVYKADRYITPLSFKEWIKWLNGTNCYYWEDENRLIHDIKLPSNTTPPTSVVEVPSVTVATSKPTPLDTLIEAGLTREEAVRAITQHFFNK